jgi:hypothetical protein
MTNDAIKPEQNIEIMDWKVVSTGENFTVLGLTEDQKVYFWRDGQWNEL